MAKLDIKAIMMGGSKVKPPSAADMRKMHIEDIANALEITPAKAARIAHAVEGLMRCDADEGEDKKGK